MWSATWPKEVRQLAEDFTKRLYSYKHWCTGTECKSQHSSDCGCVSWRRKG